MMTRLTFFILAMACVGVGWTAESGNAPKQETIGVGSGLAIGAAAGGPVGAVLGAAFGGWLGDRFHKEREARVESEREYAQATGRLEALTESLEQSEEQLAVVERERSSERTAFRDVLETAIEVQVLFHTGDSKLDEGTASRLGQIAEMIDSMDGFAVVLEGHADARGDEEYNLQLSAARAAAVREALIHAGLDASRISTSASGERFSTAGENDLDALALERRVVLSVIDQRGGGRVASK